LALFYADENFPHPVVEALRQLGHDVLTARDAGQAGLGIADDEVLAFADALGRAVLTHNRKHFRSLHKTGVPHSGIVLCTADADLLSLAARIAGAVNAAGELTGQLVRVVRPPG
jgi:hypothetical protein